MDVLKLRRSLSLASRLTAAIAGSLILSVVAAVCLARWLPGSRTLGVAVATTMAVPIWVTAMCAGFLARSSVKAWSSYLGGSVLLALATYLFT